MVSGWRDVVQVRTFPVTQQNTATLRHSHRTLAYPVCWRWTCPSVVGCLLLLPTSKETRVHVAKALRDFSFGETGGG